MSEAILTGGEGAGASGTAGAGSPGSAPPGATGGSAAASGSAAPPASWRDTLPDDLKANPSLAQFTDVANLAKSYVHAQEKIGKKGVFVPGEKASDDEWKGFFKELGQPELDKFDIKTPEGKEVNADFVKTFKEKAHAAGLLPKQAQQLVEWYVGHEENVLTQSAASKTQAAQEAIAGLKKEWGEDGYKQQVGLAEVALKTVAPELTADIVKKYGADPTVVKLLAKMGKMLGEDTIKGQGGTSGNTLEEIDGEIARLSAHVAYTDPSHAQHKSMVEQVAKLYQKRFPG